MMMMLLRLNSLTYLLLIISLVLSQGEDDGSCDNDAVANVVCEDLHPDCPIWAQNPDECDKNARLMMRSCQKSCNVCGPCEDEEDDCENWAIAGECKINPSYMLVSCRRACENCGGDEDYGDAARKRLSKAGEDFGVGQRVDEEHEDEIWRALDEMENYFKKIREDPETTNEMHGILDNCRNKNENCGLWKVLGACENGNIDLQLDCVAICQNCEFLSMDHRCPRDPDAPNAWDKGDLNQFFVNITTLPEFEKYDSHILSRPDYVNGDTSETADYQIGPWIVTLDNFVTNEEADRLIELGAEEGYERSSDVGELSYDGTFENDINTERTSMNSWCQSVCYEDPVAKQVMDKIVSMTSIPEDNSEYIQLLKYAEGQFYKRHHDCIDFDIDRQPGVRIMTIFLYLNDVEAGGGTNFPDIDITVMPKKGRALIWPSVLDEDPNQRDERTFHQALPVEKGEKYGANAWIHMRAYKESHELRCV